MESDDPDGRKRALLPMRSAFVLTVALLVALAVGGLFYAAHRSIALAVLGAGGAFAAAVTFFNVVIELWSAVASRCLPSGFPGGLTTIASSSRVTEAYDDEKRQPYRASDLRRRSVCEAEPPPPGGGPGRRGDRGLAGHCALLIVGGTSSGIILTVQTFTGPEVTLAHYKQATAFFPVFIGEAPVREAILRQIHTRLIDIEPLVSDFVSWKKSADTYYCLFTPERDHLGGIIFDWRDAG